MDIQTYLNRPIPRSDDRGLGNPVPDAAECGEAIVDITYALSVNSLFLALQALLFAALSAVLQCALALIKPGALGFGDVTTTLLIGLAVGMFGLFPVVFWWFAISVLGLLWLAIWTRFDPQKHTRFAGKTPFAPTIVVAGAISIAMHALC